MDKKILFSFSIGQKLPILPKISFSSPLVNKAKNDPKNINFSFFIQNILLHKKKAVPLHRNFKTYITMTAQRKAELGKKRSQLLQIMLAKAGITKSDIHDVAERRWVNANLDLLTNAEKQQYAEVLSL